MSNPISVLYEALSAAVYQHLPDFHYTEKDWIKWSKMSAEQKNEAVNNGTVPMTTHTRRPYTDEVNVIMFLQTWGSTALGYDGIGGAAITDAYTVIVEFQGIYCVYFGGGRLAYRIDPRNLTSKGYEQFCRYIDTRNMPSQYEMAKRYEFK